MAGGFVYLYICHRPWRGHPTSRRLWLTCLPITALPGGNRWSLLSDPFPLQSRAPCQHGPGSELCTNPPSRIRDSSEAQTIIDECGSVLTAPTLIPHRQTCCVGPTSIPWPSSRLRQQTQARNRESQWRGHHTFCLLKLIGECRPREASDLLAF